MGRLSTMFSEVYGLFVDDGVFALAILACIAAVWFVVARHGLSPGWEGAILFAGLGLTLAVSAWCRARRR